LSSSLHPHPHPRLSTLRSTHHPHPHPRLSTLWYLSRPHPQRRLKMTAQLLQQPLLVLLQLLELLLPASRHTMYRYILSALHLCFSLLARVACTLYQKQLLVEAVVRVHQAPYVHACCSHRTMYLIVPVILSAVSASCSVLNQTAVCFVLLCMLFHSVQRDASS